MSSDYSFISKDLNNYLHRISANELDILGQLREETAKLPESVMQISPLQGQFISLIVKSMNVEKALEIGVFTGYSSLCIALALPENGKLIACDIDEKWTSIASRYWKAANVDRKVELKLAPAVESLNALLQSGEEGTFDFAFIDADKESYEIYYEKSLALLRTGGMIMVDNVLWGGNVFDPTHTDASTEAIRKFNEARKQDQRVEISVLPIGDGVTLIRKL